MNKSKKTWVRFRHRIVRNVAAVFLYPYIRLVYGTRSEPFREQGKRAYLILMNHQTPFDQFFVSLSFKGAVYYLATEDIFSKGLLSSIIRYLAAPIPIVKQTSDVSALRNCMRVAREGGTIGVAPEGNRTYSGRTEYMRPGIATLAKALKLPIALYRIEGGYGVQPRWSDSTRKGRMRTYVSRVIEPEDYADMSAEQLFDEIREGLLVNDCEAGGSFRSDKKAEYLERCLYVCPFCGFSPFESRGNEVTCLSCGRTAVYGENLRLTGKGFDLPFKTMCEWYDYQSAYVKKTDLTKYTQEPLFRDRADLIEVVLRKKKQPLMTDAAFSLYGDRIVIHRDKEEICLPFSEITAAAALGRNKANIYHGGRVYQLRGGKRFNALKYVNFYYRYQYLIGGEKDGEFLGL